MRGIKAKLKEYEKKKKKSDVRESWVTDFHEGQKMRRWLWKDPDILCGLR